MSSDYSVNPPSATLPALPPLEEPSRHAEIIEEIKKAGQKQSGWGKGVLLLLISLIAFVVIGFAQWSSWEALGILVAVLFVHELGHYLAMRVFKYRNLRMFFIPFFGAAVTGRNYNVPGWKKVIVSLMGPVPGIVIGAVIGTVGLALHHALLIKIGLMAVIVNGFNLLPVLPLDGGWVAHAVLFTRHHYLDCAFRIFAALGLVALGILTETKVLAYIAIPMFLSIGLAYKLARISTGLKRRALPPASADDQTIPTETAVAIIDEIKRELPPKAQTPKSLAQHTLNVFETLNARPPGWFASTALLMVHGGALLTAVVFGVLFVVGQRGSLTDFFAAAANAPKQALNVKALSQVKLGNANVFGEATLTVVGDCGGEEQAGEGFRALSPRVPKNGGLRVFGKTLLVALPQNDDDLRKEWLEALQPYATNAFVSSTNFQATLSMVCIAMTDSNAVALYDETRGYFSAIGANLHLIAPWDAQHQPSAAERRRHLIARQTYVKLMNAGAETYTAPEAIALRKKVGNAVRQGDRVLAKTLEADERALGKELEQRAIEKLRAEGADKVDSTVIDLFTSLPENYWTNKQAKAIFQQIGEHLGQLPLENGMPSPENGRFSASGGVERNGLLLGFRWMFFQNVFEGAPAFAAWLDKLGCKDIKYQFNSGASLGDLTEE